MFLSPHRKREAFFQMAEKDNIRWQDEDHRELLKYGGLFGSLLLFSKSRALICFIPLNNTGNIRNIHISLNELKQMAVVFILCWGFSFDLSSRDYSFMSLPVCFLCSTGRC